MEIKNVNEEEKKEYPEENEIKQEVIEKRIPKKWVILGITAVAATVIGSGIYLANIMPVEDEIAGGMTVQTKNIFNSQFSQYAGKQSGSRVKSLLMTVISSNTMESIDKKVKVNGKESAADISNLINQIKGYKLYIVSCTYSNDGYVSEITITGEGME